MEAEGDNFEIGEGTKIIYVKVLKSEPTSDNEEEKEEDDSTMSMPSSEDEAPPPKRQRKPRANKLSMEEVLARKAHYFRTYRQREEVRQREKEYSRNYRLQKKLAKEKLQLIKKEEGESDTAMSPEDKVLPKPKRKWNPLTSKFTEEEYRARKKLQNWKYRQREDVRAKNRLNARKYLSNVSEEKRKEYAQNRKIRTLEKRSKMTELELEEERRNKNLRNLKYYQSLSPARRKEINVSEEKRKEYAQNRKIRNLEKRSKMTEEELEEERRRKNLGNLMYYQSLSPARRKEINARDYQRKKSKMTKEEDLELEDKGKATKLSQEELLERKAHCQQVYQQREEEQSRKYVRKYRLQKKLANETQQLCGENSKMIEKEKGEGDTEMLPEDKVSPKRKWKRNPQTPKFTEEEYRARRKLQNRKHCQREDVRAKRRLYARKWLSNQSEERRKEIAQKRVIRNLEKKAKMTEAELEDKRKATKLSREERLARKAHCQQVYQQREEVREKNRLYARKWLSNQSEEKQKEIAQKTVIRRLEKRSKMTEEELEEEKRKKSLKQFMYYQSLTPAQRRERNIRNYRRKKSKMTKEEDLELEDKGKATKLSQEELLAKKAYRRAYQQREEVRERRKELRRKYRLQKKLELAEKGKVLDEDVLEKRRLKARERYANLSEERRKELSQKKVIRNLEKRAKLLTDEELEKTRRKSNLRSFMKKNLLSGDPNSEEWNKKKAEYNRMYRASFSAEQKAKYYKVKRETDRKRKEKLEEDNPQLAAELKQKMKEYKREYYLTKIKGKKQKQPLSNSDGTLQSPVSKMKTRADVNFKKAEVTIPSEQIALDSTTPTSIWNMEASLNLKPQQEQTPLTTSQQLEMEQWLPFQPYANGFPPIPNHPQNQFIPTLPSIPSSSSALLAETLTANSSSSSYSYQPDSGEQMHSAADEDDFLEDSNSGDISFPCDESPQSPLPLPSLSAEPQPEVIQNSTTSANVSHTRRERSQIRQGKRATCQSKNHIICAICGKLCTKSNISAHKSRIHHPNYQDGKCTLCGQAFRSGFQFYHSHYLKVHKKKTERKGIGSFICHLCGKDYFTQGGLHSHQLKYHKEVWASRHQAKFKCLLCQEKFEDVKSAKEHVERSHPEEFFPCECGALRYSEASLKHHQERNCIKQGGVCSFDKDLVTWAAVLKAKLPCELCKTNLHLENLSGHYIRHGVKEEPFKCLDCDKQFRFRPRWVFHMAREHGFDYQEWLKELGKTNVEDNSKTIVKKVRKRVFGKKAKKAQVKDTERAAKKTKEDSDDRDDNEGEWKEESCSDAESHSEEDSSEAERSEDGDWKPEKKPVITRTGPSRQCRKKANPPKKPEKVRKYANVSTMRASASASFINAEEIEKKKRLVISIPRLTIQEIEKFGIRGDLNYGRVKI